MDELVAGSCPEENGTAPTSEVGVRRRKNRKVRMKVAVESASMLKDIFCLIY